MTNTYNVMYTLGKPIISNNCQKFDRNVLVTMTYHYKISRTWDVARDGSLYK